MLLLLSSPSPNPCLRARHTGDHIPRLAQGKEKERIERVWLLTDPGAPDPALVAEHPGLHIVRANRNEILRALPAAASLANHNYVVDPLGNVMMRFPRDADPRRMLKDISRLLRHSKWK